MDKYRIQGGNSLKGEVYISGSKNAALPLMTASLLTKEDVVLDNIPHLDDILTMTSLLEELGKSVIIEGNRYLIRQTHDVNFKSTYESAKVMRASISVLGPLLAFYKKAVVPFPGGCSIGARPVDLHIKAMESLGAHVQVRDGYIIAEAKEGLIGAECDLMGIQGVTVLGTANAMMAASLAEGKTVIRNAALEPEIIDLGHLLIKMGADIRGLGSSVLEMYGVKALKGVHHTVIPDRIEAGTFIAMVGAVSGELTLHNVNPEHLTEPIQIAKKMGVDIEIHNESGLYVKSYNMLKPMDINTNPYPEFPTDLQPQYIVLQGFADGNSYMVENVFENRLQHIKELNKMGFHLLEIDKSKVEINGVNKIENSTSVISTDLRAGAALIIAALAGSGVTYVEHIYHTDRGYENLEKKIKDIGGLIIREVS